MVAATKIFAFIFGLPHCSDRNLITSIAMKIPIKQYTPKNLTTSGDSGKIDLSVSPEEEQIKLDELIKELSSVKSGHGKKMENIVFEKDNDTNYHMDFLAATDNLRSRNYHIDVVDRFKVKSIAGKIIPAIATTTAMIVGAVGWEIIKPIMQKDVSTFKNSFMNLALPLWLFSDPEPPKQNKDCAYDPIMRGPVKAIPPNFTKWDKIDLKGPMTFKDIIHHFKQKY